MSITNGGQASNQPTGPGPGQEALPQLNVLAQYIKDLSFENQRAALA
jgi:preprotein translocase subunit SecB